MSTPTLKSGHKCATQSATREVREETPAIPYSTFFQGEERVLIIFPNNNSSGRSAILLLNWKIARGRSGRYNIGKMVKLMFLVDTEGL